MQRSYVCPAEMETLAAPARTRVGAEKPAGAVCTKGGLDTEDCRMLGKGVAVDTAHERGMGTESTSQVQAWRLHVKTGAAEPPEGGGHSPGAEGAVCNPVRDTVATPHTPLKLQLSSPSSVSPACDLG